MKKAVCLLVLLLLAARVVGAQNAPPPLWPKHAELGKYLFLAAKAMIPGTVTVTCHLRTDGTVYLAEPRSGQPLLAQASAENSVAWSFFIAKDKPAPSVELTYEYLLIEGGFAGRAQATVELPRKVVVTIETGKKEN